MFTVAVIAKISRPSDSTRVAAYPDKASPC